MGKQRYGTLTFSEVRWKGTQVEATEKKNYRKRQNRVYAGNCRWLQTEFWVALGNSRK